MESLVVELPDFRRALEPIHKWHIAVHQYQAVFSPLPPSLFCYILLDNLVSFFSIHGTIQLEWLDVELELKNGSQSINVEDLVIYN